MGSIRRAASYPENEKPAAASTHCCEQFHRFFAKFRVKFGDYFGRLSQVFFGVQQQRECQSPCCGHLSALVGTSGGKKAFAPIGGNDRQSDRVQAVCDIFGPANFGTVMQQAADELSNLRSLDLRETDGILSRAQDRLNPVLAADRRERLQQMREEYKRQQQELSNIPERQD